MRGDPSKRVNCYEGGGSWALCPNIRGYKNDGHKKLRQKALIFLRNYLTIILHLEKLPSFFPYICPWIISGLGLWLQHCKDCFSGRKTATTVYVLMVEIVGQSLFLTCRSRQEELEFKAMKIFHLCRSARKKRVNPKLTLGQREKTGWVISKMWKGPRKCSEAHVKVEKTRSPSSVFEMSRTLQSQRKWQVMIRKPFRKIPRKIPKGQN